MIFYIVLCIVVIILAIIIWGGVTKWKFIKRKDGYEKKKKLTIYFPYYNQPDVLQKQLENYSKMSPEIKKKITIFIVDDGSMKSPAIDVIKNFKGNLHIILYRINIDIPWNMPEADNLAFSKTQTDYVFCTNIDHFFIEEELNKLLNIDLKQGIFYTINRRSEDGIVSHPHPHSYLIHKDDYWKINGMNEYFSGNYGHDDKDFISRLKKKFKNKYFSDIYITNAGKDAAATGLNRSVEINAAKLNEKNKPHLIFQHKNKYQFLFEKIFEKYIPFTTKLKKYMKSPKMNSDKWVKHVDKVLFKDYAKSKGVDTAKIILGPFDDANEMKLKDIPENCVLKLNNGSGRNIGIKNGKIIFDGPDGPNEHFKGKLVKDVWNNIKKQLNDWRRPFNTGEEPWYSHIKPKIFVEELLDPVPPDIRFWTFNGKVGAIHITQNARMGLEHCQTYYDRNGNEIDCKLEYPKCKNQEKPENLDEMVKAAESLGEGLEFARIDLYNYNGKILGGEITFAPYAGNVEFKPKSCDIMLSNFWN